MDALTAFTAICPAYATDPAVNIFVSLAIARTSLSLFGVNYGLAVALRAAHMMTLSKRIGGESGAVGSKREGDLAVHYNKNTKVRDDELDLTHYGQQLQGLIREGTVIIGSTGGNDRGRNDEPFPDIPANHNFFPDVEESE